LIVSRPPSGSIRPYSVSYYLVVQHKGEAKDGEKEKSRIEKKEILYV
jgi:hypothetical protein